MELDQKKYNQIRQVQLANSHCQLWTWAFAIKKDFQTWFPLPLFLLYELPKVM